jgi:serine phosphatase RsbU (regulator of sigma subunit)
MKPNHSLEHELRTGAQYAAQYLTPIPGAIPRLPGIDIYGLSIPLNGVAGGDLITYVDFQQRFDLDARIWRAVAQKQDSVVRNLQQLKRIGGVLVADVAGHEFRDSLRALMLHQAFHTGALYEMDLNGEITVRLLEQINSRFLTSMTLRNLHSDDFGTYITLIYGEISNSGRFRFISAGHPPPLVFSRVFDHFVEISPDRMMSYPPVGLQPSEDYPDVQHFDASLGYKKCYTMNELNLMGEGDILLLYTDGLLDPFSTFTQGHLERIVSGAQNESAKGICSAIVRSIGKIVEQRDDLSLVVIKRS